MAFYISNKQIQSGYAKSAAYIPTLLSARHGFKHRVFTPPYKFSRLLLDSYEVVNRRDKDVAYPILPTSCITLVFLLGRHTRGELWGCNTTLRQLIVPPKHTAYCVRLRPGAFRFFSSIDVNELTDQVVPLEQWIPAMEKLYQPMRYGESFHERNIMVQRLLERMDGKDFCVHEKVMKTIDFIEAHEGMVKINDLAEAMNCTTRYLGRIFLQHIGVATKMYCQILQMNLSLQSILETKPKSLLDTAIAYGYVDQAHMNRVYRKYLDCTAYDMKNYGVQNMSHIDILLDSDDERLQRKSRYLFHGFV